MLIVSNSKEIAVKRAKEDFTRMPQFHLYETTTGRFILTDGEKPVNTVREINFRRLNMKDVYREAEEAI